jgi:ABC-type glycerol-3-phosphate transport system substrate-binding protein
MPNLETEAPAPTEAPAEVVTITYLVDNNPTTLATAENQIAAIEVANPGINLELETRLSKGEIGVFSFNHPTPLLQ